MNAPRHDFNFRQNIRKNYPSKERYTLLWEHYVIIAIVIATWIPIIWIIFSDYIRDFISFIGTI